jgi:hypothetical protein
LNGEWCSGDINVSLQAKRMSKDEGFLKTKERIGDGVRAAKAKLGYVESRL